ncbi:MAG: hypothetical protein KDA45_01830 [Planctomycetales bacterium]|nr:hypothetical protein [Planctomycetales bacterium]
MPQHAQTAAESLLTAAQLKNGSITVSPDTIDENTSTVTVRVDIPVAENSWISPFFFSKSVVSSSVTLLTERPPAVQLTGIPGLQNGILGIDALGLGL